MVPYISLEHLFFGAELPLSVSGIGPLVRETRKRWQAEFELKEGAAVAIDGISFLKNEIFDALEDCLDEKKYGLRRAISRVPGLEDFLELRPCRFVAWQQLGSGQNSSFLPLTDQALSEWDQPGFAQLAPVYRRSVIAMASVVFRERFRACWNSYDAAMAEELALLSDHAPEPLLSENIHFIREKKKFLLDVLRHDLAQYTREKTEDRYLALLTDESAIRFWQAFFGTLPDIARFYCSYYEFMVDRDEPEERIERLLHHAGLAVPLAGDEGWQLTELVRVHRQKDRETGNSGELVDAMERHQKNFMKYWDNITGGNMRVSQRLLLFIILVILLILMRLF